MKKRHKIIFLILIVLAVIFTPSIFCNIKFDMNKKALHVDKDRYEQVNNVCFNSKDTNSCTVMLQEDLSILMNAHKENEKIIAKPVPLSDMKTLARRYYKITENKQNIEPEIFLKTMMLKSIYLKKDKNQIKSAMFGENMKNYIANNFSHRNRQSYVNALDMQDKDLMVYIKKQEAKKNRRTIVEIVDGENASHYSQN